MKQKKSRLRIVLALSLVIMMSLSIATPAFAYESDGQQVDDGGEQLGTKTRKIITNTEGGEGEQEPAVYKFDIETECFDYGQLVRKLHIHLDEELVDATEENIVDAFSVFVMNYVRNFYGIPFDDDYPRTIIGAGISEDGKTITLELESLYADSIIGGANYGMFSDGYAVTLESDLGNLIAGEVEFEHSGISFDSESDKWEAVEETATTYNYRYFAPELDEYTKPEDGFPIVVWLHGGGEGGSGNNYDNNIQITANRVTAWGQSESQDLFGGAYIIAPQTSRNVSSWTGDGVIATIESFIDLVGEGNIDRDRIYIGGCSMGGMGTWTVIKAYPDYFAAAFPICAMTSYSDAQIEALKDLPIYLIHSVDDTTVNISGSIDAYNTLIGAGKENIYLAFFSQVWFEGLAENEQAPGHWSWVYVHNDFDGKGADEEYWLEEYVVTNEDTEDKYVTTEPSDLDYASFKAWLAGQINTSDEAGRLISNVSVAYAPTTQVSVPGEGSNITGTVDVTYPDGIVDETFTITFGETETYTIPSGDGITLTLSGAVADAGYTADDFMFIGWTISPYYFWGWGSLLEVNELSLKEDLALIPVFELKPPSLMFDIETTCFDYGQLVTKLHIHLEEALVDATEENIVDAFSVFVMNYVRNFYGTPFEGDFERTVTGAIISEDGKTITLELESLYADSIIGGANYGMFSDGYAVTLESDLGNLIAGEVEFKHSGISFDPEADKWEAEEETETTYNYRYFAPELDEYTKPEAGFPLVVWLHGAGERGSGNNYDNNIQITANRVTAWGQSESQDSFGGAYIIAPQTSRNVSSWTAYGVVATVESFIDLVGEENIDRNRIYIGGCSMGGMGTWTVIKAYPDYFAAAFPICANTSFNEAQLEALKDLPIYLIHSVDDTTVRISGSINAYNALRDAGNKNTYLAFYEHVVFDGLAETELGPGHWSWVYVHNDFDGKGADEEYWLEEYVVTNENTEDKYVTTKPSDLDYASFKAWLADQVNGSEDEGRLESDVSVSFSQTTQIIVPGEGGDVTETVNVSYPDGIADSIFTIVVGEPHNYAIPTGDGITFTLSGAVSDAGFTEDHFEFVGWTTTQRYFSGRGSLVDVDEMDLIADLFLIPVFELKPSGKFDIETTCFDYGQLVTRLHIHLEEALVDATEEEIADAFSVVVKNYVRSFYGTEFDGDYDRTITGASISEDGKTITLELESLNADGVIGGANYGMYSDGYAVTLKSNLGNFEMSEFTTKYSGKSFDLEADKWGAVEETETTYNYRYFDPTGDEYTRPRDGFPIVVWLHGGGENGASNNYDNNIQLTANRVTAWGQKASQDLFGGAYVIAPQTSRNVSRWTGDGVVATIEAFIDMVGERNVNRNRIYIGGCSMGGGGTWTTLKAYPDYFTAAFPICAGSTFDEGQAESLKDLPIYYIHSVDDPVVNVNGIISAYNALRDAGNDNIYLALYEHVWFEGLAEGELGVGHWSWVYAHNDFDGEGSDEEYWLDEYVDDNEDTYAATKPGELGYASFKAWLADQEIVPDTPPYYPPYKPPVDDDGQDDGGDEIVVPQFDDISNHWAEAHILRVAEKGLFVGTSATQFSPEMTMTRAMFVTVLGRLANIDADTYGNTSGFEDVPDGWYSGYVAWAAVNGIVTGRNERIFDPDAPVAREELAVMIYRYIRHAELDLTENSGVTVFTDIGQVSSWAQEAVEYLQSVGLFEGRGDNRFDPQATATRAELATAMSRLLDLLDLIETTE